jgi:rhodanese-related sulfurtransferase
MIARTATRLVLLGFLATAAIVAFTLRDHLDLACLDAVGLLAIMAFVPRVLRRLRSEPVAWIEAAELKTLLDADEPPLVVDVRSRAEFEGDLGHIGPALNLPVEDLPARMAALDNARRRKVALVCHTDKRSAKGAEILRAAGFADVVVLRGGITRWRAAGHPVSRA